MKDAPIYGIWSSEQFSIWHRLQFMFNSSSSSYSCFHFFISPHLTAFVLSFFSCHSSPFRSLANSQFLLYSICSDVSAFFLHSFNGVGKNNSEWEKMNSRIHTPVLTNDSIVRSFNASVSPCFILIRFLSKHFMAYIFPVSALRQPYTSPKPPRPMIRWTLKSFIVNWNRKILRHINFIYLVAMH